MFLQSPLVKILRTKREILSKEKKRNERSGTSNMTGWPMVISM